MHRFYSLKIKEVIQETQDCISVIFDVPEALKEVFTFKPGQHLTLREFIGGEDVRRSYSICTSPSEEQLKVAIKKIEGGKFSNYAQTHFKAGREVDVMPPTGNFHPKNFGAKINHVVAFVAGSGITPVMSIMKSFLDHPEQGTFTLVYGNRSTMDIIFLEEIEGLKNRFMTLLSVFYLLSREDPGSEIYHGRLDKAKTLALLDAFIDTNQTTDFLVCGPSGLIDSVMDALKEKGVASDRISYERFNTTGIKSSEAVKKAIKESSVHSRITITIDGKTSIFDYATPELSILDAAQASGADLPFACKGGVCCTCRAKVLKGKANMEVNYGLEPEEISAGYILTCQAHPVTDAIDISFDD